MRQGDILNLTRRENFRIRDLKSPAITNRRGTILDYLRKRSCLMPDHGGNQVQYQADRREVPHTVQRIVFEAEGSEKPTYICTNTETMQSFRAFKAGWLLGFTWRAMGDSNARPLVPETNALST